VALCLDWDIEIMVDVSVIVPVKNEAENIASVAKELDEAMNRHAWTWECIWVDDGSTDGSLSIIEAMAVADPHHRFVSFERNAGQSAAFGAGFG
jgi:dolichol-phosphate mannosyltransferase